MFIIHLVVDGGQESCLTSDLDCLILQKEAKKCISIFFFINFHSFRLGNRNFIWLFDFQDLSFLP